MATFELQMAADRYHFRHSVEFDGTRYLLDFHWNDHGLFWWIDLRDSDGEPLVVGKALRTGVDLLHNYKHLAIPQGSIDLIDAQALGGEPDDTNLGGRFLFRYTEPDGV